MTSNILQTELSNLIQESKRKNADLKHAAEQSLGELRALPSTSEQQLAADLVRKPHFAKPFILACHSKHAKLSGIGVLCLQRLVASRSLPAEQLKDVLDGLKETTGFGLDVQLKILQTLPSLLQNYSEDLHGELIGTILETCGTLQCSKTAAVGNTAAATLQQLLLSIFEKVSNEDEKANVVPATSLSIDDKQIDVGPAAYDAYRVLDDLCRHIEGESLQFLQIKSLSPIFILELIESVLTNNGNLFAHHPEQVQVLRFRLMPLTMRYLTERHNFRLTVRMARILFMLLKRHLKLLSAECEMALSLLTHLLDPDAAAPWKRVLCMEIFRGLHSEPALIRLIYFMFDEHEDRKSIIRDHMASLVRLASEKPSLIGVGNQSTVPVGLASSRDDTEEQVALESGGVAGVIGSAVSSADANVPGISNQWSLVRTPYMELMDKTDAPNPPDTYIYSLVLNCISAFSEGLAKFILPLTVPEKGKRKHRGGRGADRDDATDANQLQRASSGKSSSGTQSKKTSISLNPLELESHPQLSGIRTSANIVDTCWPAVLATCSTFLYAALDGEFYHNLVRSFQKLTHVAGLLRLSTPRDAFLTTLGKAAVPADSLSQNAPTPILPQGLDTQIHTSMDKKLLGPDSASVQSPTDTRRSSFDTPPATLSTRNLLCLRALLNLGIALGPTLDQPSWFIILETLQHAELVISLSAAIATKQAAPMSPSGESNPMFGSDVPKANLGAEIIAVQTAASKMFESTGDYPTISFKYILTALLGLSDKTKQGLLNSTPEKSPSSPQTSRRQGRMHQGNRTMSFTLGRSKLQDDELAFVIEKTNHLVKANLERLSTPSGEEDVWHILIDNLVAVTRNGDVSSSLRCKASEALNNVSFQTMQFRRREDVSARNEVQLRGLLALKSQITTLYDPQNMSASSSRAADFEVHELALETLKSILEQCGESLVAGWDLVFDLISSVFDDESKTENGVEDTPVVANRRSRKLVAKSPKLIRTAYDSLQLVASDFLTLLPASCLLSMTDTFSEFAAQKEDFNISLTTTTFFWNVSDFLQGQIDRISLEGRVDLSSSEEALAKLSKDDDILVSRNALWFLLLLRVVELTTDSRSEIRNSATKTVLRIFDAYGQRIPAKAWHLCLNRVLFVMVEPTETKLRSLSEAKTLGSEEGKAWIETTVVMTKGFANLISSFFETITQYPSFGQSWHRLLRFYEATIKIGLFELDEAVFSSLTEILTRVTDREAIGLKAVQSAWEIWVNGHPIVQEEAQDLEAENQLALLSYLRSFQQIYRLLKDEMTQAHVDQILDSLRTAVWESVSSRYSPDIDRQSELQTLVISCLKDLCLDMDSSQPAIILCLADFSDCALTKWSPEKDRSRPTFISFSKASMDLLSWYITDHGIKGDIFSNNSLTKALEHLAHPIVRKYGWRGRDKEPALWKKATTASLNIFQVAIPYVETNEQDRDREKLTEFWKCVVDITRGVVSAGPLSDLSIPTATILTDEAFDIDAFARLKGLIIPSLGSSLIPDKIRRDFACALFTSSLIHTPHRLDLPAEVIDKEPLRELYTIRMGRTHDPPPTPRSKIAYVLIDTLFDLSAAYHHPPASSSSARISLSKSVSPYLILRSALPLKSYIADQPLRGLMPQPTSTRKELLHLLDKLVILESEPAAIPDVSSSSSSVPGDGSSRARNKKHLGWVYRLVVRALQVAGRENEDGRVLEGLGRVLEEVGGGGGDSGDGRSGSGSGSGSEGEEED
ncbi:hypothetical protein FQN54_005727 [Arachnomyces sp. PD_36]|nr:hypothetical protein FQN54_005727 [Arachnomyces sp. PD_36]